MERAPELEGPDVERDRICAAMIELAAGRSYRLTSVDHVVRRAGTDRDAFARHFDSLEDCFAAAWDQVDGEVNRRMRAAFELPGEWEDQLRAALHAALAHLASDEGRARLYVAEVHYVDDRLRERQRAAMARLSATIDLGRAGASDAERVPEHISDAISGAIWHRVRHLVQTGRGAELPDEVPRLMYLAVQPYRGTAAAEAELHWA